jgi:nucleolar GTP-binding protein
VQRQRNRMARQGDADHRETASKAKWLLAGKRGNGTHRSR